MNLDKLKSLISGRREYIVFHAGRKINLISMETAVFKSWREERLQRKEEEEKKKRDAELCVVSMPIADDDAAVLIVPVSAATEDIDHTSDAYCVEVDVFRVYLKPRSVSPEGGGEDDMAPPMFNGGYYAILGYVVAETVKPQFLFLFLPRKEKIKVAIGVPCWWRVLSLQESGWGPPGGSLRMARQESSEFRDAEETGLSGLLPPDYPA